MARGRRSQKPKPSPTPAPVTEPEKTAEASEETTPEETTLTNPQKEATEAAGAVSESPSEEEKAPEVAGQDGTEEEPAGEPAEAADSAEDDADQKSDGHPSMELTPFEAFLERIKADRPDVSEGEHTGRFQNQGTGNVDVPIGGAVPDGWYMTQVRPVHEADFEDAFNAGLVWVGWSQP